MSIGVKLFLTVWHNFFIFFLRIGAKKAFSGLFLPLFLLIFGITEKVYSTGFQLFKTPETRPKPAFRLKSVHTSGRLQ